MTIMFTKDGQPCRLMAVTDHPTNPNLARYRTATADDLLAALGELPHAEEGHGPAAERAALLATIVTLEGQVAIARDLLQDEWRGRDGVACGCARCRRLAALFSADGGRAMVEEIRQVRAACREALDTLGNWLRAGRWPIAEAKDLARTLAGALGAHVTFLD